MTIRKDKEPVLICSPLAISSSQLALSIGCATLVIIHLSRTETIIALSFSATSPTTETIRRVDLRTDLEPLADLISLVFADSMDENGRAAIREMRMLSRLGWGLQALARLNDLMSGISMGYVWVEDDRLVGNVSIYPANYPPDLGDTWIIANVAVHPDHQRRGIATRLMHESLQAIRRQRGRRVILQVDYDNEGALKLYESLGFIRERAFSYWRRSAMVNMPPPLRHDRHITRPRRSEWRAEMRLAAAQRPTARGGIGWLRPVHKREFAPSFWQQLGNTLSMNNTEHLIIRSDDEESIVATTWIETGLTLARIRLTLIADPAHFDACVPPLMNNVLRRYSSSGFALEHPQDDEQANEFLRAQRFYIHRTVWSMRWDLS